MRVRSIMGPSMRMVWPSQIADQAHNCLVLRKEPKYVEKTFSFGKAAGTKETL